MQSQRIFLWYMNIDLIDTVRVNARLFNQARVGLAVAPSSLFPVSTYGSDRCCQTALSDQMHRALSWHG